MRRTYDRERYLDRVALIREHVPDAALSTDIIVGFPGESEAEFEQTLSLVDEVGYDGAFTFLFSPRRGTEAATITEGLVPHEVKVARIERLVELVQRRAHERAQRFVGRTVEVLVEGHEPHRPRPAARPHAPQQGRQLLRACGAGRARAGRDRARDQPDAERRRAPARPRALVRRRDARGDRRLRARAEEPAPRVDGALTGVGLAARRPTPDERGSGRSRGGESRPEQLAHLCDVDFKTGHLIN